MQKIKILVADGRWAVHLGIRSLFGISNEMDVVGEAGGEVELAGQLSRLAPDVLLLNLTRMGGLKTIHRIHALRPRARVVLIADSGTMAEIAAAVGEGALGCVSMDSDPEDFVDAIRRMHCGEAWFPAALSCRLLQKSLSGGEAGTSAEPLTQRESEILRLIAQGLEDRDISRALCVSKGTVRTHVSNTLGKLGLRNRVEATLYALRHGLVSLDPEVSRSEGGKGLTGAGRSHYMDL